MRKGDIWILEAAQPTVGTRCPQVESLALGLSLSCRIVKDCKLLNFSEKYTYKGSQPAQPRRYEVADKAGSHMNTESRPFQHRSTVRLFYPALLTPEPAVLDKHSTLSCIPNPG